MIKKIKDLSEVFMLGLIIGILAAVMLHKFSPFKEAYNRGYAVGYDAGIKAQISDFYDKMKNAALKEYYYGGDAENESK